MERATDWSALWRQLVAVQERNHNPEGLGDAWKERARHYAERVRRKWAQPDQIRDFLVRRIKATDTILDVGAGTGSWAVPLARVARRLTALDPSPAMREVLAETLAAEGVTNVDVVAGSWPGASVEPHDVTLCAHAMYGAADLAGFVRRMVEVTSRSCYLLLRAPTADGVMTEAARRVWGQPHDSPNFAVAYNLLLDQGYRPNVLVDPTLWDPWTSQNLEAALAEVKGKLGAADSVEHDDFLRDLLARRLTAVEGGFAWPRAIQSVLVYWDVAD